MAKQSGYYLLFLLFLVNMLNFFDRQIPGALTEFIRDDWSLNDKQLGALSTAFTLFYAVMGLPLGYLADRANRMKLLAGGVFVWSLLTALSGTAKNFAQLFVYRLGVGAGEAICAPAASSLIGDTFPSERRARAMSIFMLGLPIGLGIAFPVSSYIAKTLGWKYAFILAGIPGVLIALLLLGLKEPPRGTAEKTATAVTRRPGNSFLIVLGTPTMMWIIISGILHNFNMYALGGFISSLLVRYHGVDKIEASFWSMGIYGLSGVPGLLLGGWLVDKASHKGGQWRLWVGAIALLICAPLMYFSLQAPSGQALQFALLMGAACGIMYIYYSSVYPTIQDIIEPGLRGSAMAVYFMAMYVCGASFGPLATGALSDHFTIKAAQAAGVMDTSQAALQPFAATGLHSAMQVLPLLALGLGVVLILASMTVRKDRARLQRWMDEQAELAN